MLNESFYFNFFKLIDNLLRNQERVGWGGDLSK